MEKPKFVDYYCFLSLFTTVTAGPIERHRLLKQLQHENSIQIQHLNEGFNYIVSGLFLKVLIAERMRIISSGVFSNINSSNGLVIAIASICFSIEIYCDFEGYSLLAFGLSKCIGLDLTQNFYSPYAAISIADLWHRWHISLSTWFRDYIYIPLGENRCSRPRQVLNTMITFCLSGLWHGSSMNYLLWGGLHGAVICIEKGKKKKEASCSVLKRLLILSYINLSWMIFRIENLPDLILCIKKVFLEFIPTLIKLKSFRAFMELLYSFNTTIPNAVACGIAILLFCVWVCKFDKHQINKPAISFGMLVLTLIFGITGSAGEFIYASY